MAKQLSQFENMKRIHRSGAYRKHSKEVAEKEAKSKALEGAKSGGLIGKLKSQIAESEKARSGNWRDLLGKK